MKLSLRILVLGALFCIAVPAHVTVGGETVLSAFTYNPADESVYYIKHDGGGRGCPPELLKLSLSSGESVSVLSCDQGEKMLSASGDYTSNTVGVEISRLTTDFKYLTPIDLTDNGISIAVNFVKTEMLSDEPDMVARRHFTATIYQKDRQLAVFPITGCNLDQPFIFQGYAVPGFNKKIVILLSAKDDCFEGGYISESLYVVGGLDSLERGGYTNFYKGASPLVPNETSLVVYTSEPVVSKTVFTPLAVGVILGVFCIGLVGGLLFRRKTSI
jgi:hypothetical protein